MARLTKEQQAELEEHLAHLAGLPKRTYEEAVEIERENLNEKN
jgi:hypothetical protein